MPPLPLYFLFPSCFLFGSVWSFQHGPVFESASDSVEDGVLPAAEEDQTVVVTCHQDSVEVVVRAHLLDPGLVGLGLGPDGAGGGPCTAWLSADGHLSIRAPLVGCGSRVMLSDGDLLYFNLLLLLLSAPSGQGSKVEAAAVPVLCKRRRRFMVSSGALRPTWTPLVSVHSARLSLDFTLRLMTDDWTDERNSPVYFMDQTVNMQASLDLRHPPLRLFADSCVATLTPAVNSQPRYPFIDHQGCFVDSLLSGSVSRFLPRFQDQVLQIQLQPFLFYQDHRHDIYVTCVLEAEPILKTEKKACSFINDSWRSVDGADHVCESCSRTETSHKSAHRSRRAHRNKELHRETTLGPIIVVPERTDDREDRGKSYREP
ncbi:zona pellucida sperm-binding protein 3 [Austrofundulus limnaeus]|uniref:Zona pellucida sperm-binding protein 3 n=1 Tax=Austrofundulus limnaeus TaxID=52670 RepID=A0A2I4CJ41_AUSLI|nr:PREDICTED: zona pellucida sperm-binding protein 3-like [Austrofundulus limnaeus]